jgi:hypothetical protein
MVPKVCINSNPILDHLSAKFRSVHTPEYDMSVDESLMMWKGHLPQTF